MVAIHTAVVILQCPLVAWLCPRIKLLFKDYCISCNHHRELYSVLYMKTTNVLMLMGDIFECNRTNATIQILIPSCSLYCKLVSNNK